MRKLYICGSFRFSGQMLELKRRLKEEKIDCQTPKRNDIRGIMGCLRKIDEAEAVYVVDPGGYIGKSVSVDIGYAYARNKPIFVMCGIHDPPVMGLTSGVLSPQELVDFVKKGFHTSV